MNERQKIVLAANTAWNISNYRIGLLRSLQQAGMEPVVLAPKDSSEDRTFEELGVKHVNIEVDRSGTNPIRDAVLFAAYWRILRDIRPAAFLSFTAKPNIYGCIAARTLGIPAFPNISGLGTVFAGRGLLKSLMILMYRFSLRVAPVVFFQNEEDRDEFIRRKIVQPEQARRIPGSGVDLDHFKFAELPDGPVVFLLISRLLRNKGIVEFVEAAHRQRQRGSDARWRMVGPLDPENPSALDPRALQYWIDQGIVEHLGAVDDVRPCIRASTVVVLPSTYREGVPRSLLEGAAMGRPLITTSTAGCRDVVDHGKNGFVCAPRDAAALADAMEAMMRMGEAERSAMGRHSRKVAEERFDERIVIAAYLQALHELRPTGNMGEDIPAGRN